MLKKLNKQLSGEEWAWNNLNTLCWAIGSISGSMAEDQVNFLLALSLIPINRNGSSYWYSSFLVSLRHFMILLMIYQYLLVFFLLCSGIDCSTLLTLWAPCFFFPRKIDFWWWLFVTCWIYVRLPREKTIKLSLLATLCKFGPSYSAEFIPEDVVHPIFLNNVPDLCILNWKIWPLCCALALLRYVVGQYPRFLRAHWKFLKTVVNKLFEFMHETHPGVQVAFQTFNVLRYSYPSVNSH